MADTGQERGAEERGEASAPAGLAAVAGGPPPTPVARAPAGSAAPAPGTVAVALRPLGRLALSFAAVLALWQGTVTLFAPPPFMLPSPLAVAAAMAANADRLAADTLVTLSEIVLGLVAGILFGIATAVVMALAPALGRLLQPVLVVSQALPVFALAPLLVLWFGFGLASKVVMATVVIYFPVASALADGLRRTDPGLLDLAALSRAGRWRTLALIRFPAALPALVTGIRVAAVFAPIGAVIGEWVGASHGLGLAMIEANARMKTDLLFAALAVLAAVTLVLRALADAIGRRLVPWAEAD